MLSRFQIAIWPLCILLIIIILAAFDGYIHDAIRFDYHAIKQGEWWRLLTAHVIHLNFTHTALNGAGFLLIAWMLPKGHWVIWLAFYVASALFISTMVYLKAEVFWYVGASGVLHGLMMLAAFFSRWLEPWRRFAMLLLILGKVIWEQTPWYSDEQVYSMIGGHVVVDSHFWGAMAALFVIIIYYLSSLFSNKAQS